MTGNRERERIRRTRPCHGACRTAGTGTLRKFRVGNGRSGVNVSKRFPDTTLKRRAPYVEWKIQSDRWHFHKAHHCRHDLTKPLIVTHERRVGKAVLELANEDIEQPPSVLPRSAIA